MSVLNEKKVNLFAPVGRLVEIDGFTLHVYVSGPANVAKDMPTILIEAGCGCPLLFYSWLQEKLSKTLRVCSYDRSGLGWSSDNHQPHDAEHVAKNLHTLLKKADITGPIILVGHSIAGFYIRVYAKQYPENIIGLVFLDASHPNHADFSNVRVFNLRQRIQKRIMAVYAGLGISKLLPPVWELKRNTMQFLPETSKRRLIYLFGFRQSYITPLVEADAFGLSAEQARETGHLGELPLLVITAPNRDSNFPTGVNWKEHIAVWMDLQKNLLKLSSNSRHTVIDGAGHCTLITKKRYAGQVADEISQFFNL